MEKTYDFAGWATKVDLLCSDGRIIRKDAFKAQDGQQVPLVWNHQHNEPTNVLGHAILENRDEGVYAYCTFNDTESGQEAKKLVEHGDVNSLSIWANKLKQDGPNVVHGVIREVSLVLASANPEAYIDSVMVHGEENGESGIIYTGEQIELFHSEDSDSQKKEKKEMQDSENKKTENKGEEPNSENKKTENKGEEPNKEKTIGEIFETLTDEQKEAVYAIVGAATEEAGDEEDEEDNDMKHNAFEGENNTNVLSHSEMTAIIADAKRCGSLKESFLAHSSEYGIENIDWLFPEAKTLNGGAPEFIKRSPDAWVEIFMKGVHHSPFSRIKSIFADITGDDARAKGYVKGNIKMEEVFGLLKRTTSPTTVYKKQKLDRDDVADITDFDVIAWLKAEMRTMLDEEIARACLFSDGRNSLSEDKINEDCIRPVLKDTVNNFYAMEKTITPASGETLGHAMIDGMVKAQDNYQGSGNIYFFTAPSTVSDMLLLEDTIGHRLYKDMNDLALAMNISKIVKVPADIIPRGYYGVALDLKDYNIGADKGGSVNMFDDFDIDYNQMKYLIETRCSGALVKPHSAIVLKAAAQG